MTQYVEAFNHGDLDALRALFVPDAVGAAGLPRVGRVRAPSLARLVASVAPSTRAQTETANVADRSGVLG